MTRYDRTGRTYSHTRRGDPRIAAAISDAVAGADSVANVGAGTGSYEPPQTIAAIEPSEVMIRQRPVAAAPAVQAAAEALPLRTDAVDSVLAVLTVHHWTDLTAGVAEMRRVARRRVIVLTWDHEVIRDFWLLRDYVPAAADTDARLAIPIGDLVSLLGPNRVAVTPIPVPHDCDDGFGGAYWRRPQAYLDETVRQGMSLFSMTPADHVTEGLTRLRGDLESGQWRRRYAELLHQPELDLGYRLLVADVSKTQHVLRSGSGWQCDGSKRQSYIGIVVDMNTPTQAEQFVAKKLASPPNAWPVHSSRVRPASVR